jgi:hypothetical protein
MKNSVSVNIARFVALMIVQIYIFNNVNLFGYINPYPYVLFLLVFPFTANRALYIFIAFLTGLTMDMFGNNAIKLSKVSFYERFIFISIMVLIHHLVLFLLEVFNISNILYTLNKTLVTSIFTIILCLTFNILFSSRNE